VLGAVVVADGVVDVEIVAGVEEDEVVELEEDPVADLELPQHRPIY
jgi:hypothetical protein